jgi:hypothetical protein
MVIFGAVFGSYHWIISWQKGLSTPAGTVMLSAIPIIIGVQFILAFLAYDISTIPRRPLHRKQPKSAN